MPIDRVLLFTDVVDSTRLTEQLGDEAASRLWAEHDRVARGLMATWHGREIDKSDGFLLLFDAVADAVAFAIDLHKALVALQPPLSSRAGIHAGPMVARPNSAHDIALGAKPLELDGIGKALAARVMALARGGQTLLSAGANTALAGRGPWRTQSHGHWRLKGLVDPIELFEVGYEGTPFVPPPDSAKAYRVMPSGDGWTPLAHMRHGLPAERDAFVGRMDALKALAARFDGDARLVSLLGIGGIGKTRLALRYARDWLGNWPGGAWFCDLSTAHSLDGIVHAVAQGLDVPLGKADPVQQLGAAIAGRGECLVILDNFEQVARHAEATVGAWLARAPEARFLVTTREVLGIGGEEAVALAPMSLDEGAALFERRARAADSGYQAEPADSVALPRLVELLDRLPLAIELAAARVRVMGVSTMLGRMGERFKLLVGGRGRTERQMTLRATLDWSWELLSEPERIALAQLSVFEGGATLAAAEAAIDLHASTPPLAVVDVLQSLIDKSFVRSATNGRLSMLTLVQEYAEASLIRRHPDEDSGAATRLAAQRRHAAYFSALQVHEAVLDACIELPNLIAATRHCTAIGDAETASRVLVLAWSALRLRGPFSMGLELARDVQAMADLSAAQQARVHRSMAGALHAVGQDAQARWHFSEALRCATDAGDLGLQALARAHLGDLLVVSGQGEQGRAELALAWTAACSQDDRPLQAQVLVSLGAADQHAGRLDAAAEHYAQALAIAQRLRDRRRCGGVLGNLGTVRHQQGRLDEARRLYEAALEASLDSGDRQWAGNTQSNLGLLLQQQGHLDEAGEALASALRSARELGQRRLECISLSNLGQLAEAQQDAARAQQLFEQALALARELADRLSSGQIAGSLAALHTRGGDFDAARPLFDEGARMLDSVAGQLSLGLLLCDRAECEHKAGGGTAAHSYRDAARHIADELHSGPGSELAERLLLLDRQLEAAVP